MVTKRNDSRTKEPTAEFIDVTPEMAKHWLQTLNNKPNGRPNRHLRRSDITTLARDMLAGDYLMTGEAIKFDWDGWMLDGQHRCEAIIQANKPAKTLVVRGLDPRTQDVMDTGRKRTAANMLEMSGEANSSTLSAAARLALGVEAGVQRPGSYEVTNAEIGKFTKANPDLRRAVEVTKPLVRYIGCRPAIVAYSYFLMAKVDKFDAFEFWKTVADGTARRPHDPARTLGKLFDYAKANRRPLTKNQTLSAIFRAWNADRKGQDLRFLRVKSPTGGDIGIPVLYDGEKLDRKGGSAADYAEEAAGE